MRLISLIEFSFSQPEILTVEFVISLSLAPSHSNRNRMLGMQINVTFQTDRQKESSYLPISQGKQKHETSKFFP